MNITSASIVPTTSARRYMSQLVKHFGHRTEAGLAGETGHIDFGFGRCELAARPNGLVLKAAAEDEAALVRLEDVVARHLQRFAFREPLQVGWVRT